MTDELLAAILALDDNALGNVSATPLSDVPGSNKRTVQIEGRGRVRTVFKTVVECAPGEPWATYTPVEVRVAIGELAGTVRTGTVPGTGGQLVPDGGLCCSRRIDPENLRRSGQMPFPRSLLVKPNGQASLLSTLSGLAAKVRRFWANLATSVA